MFGFSWIIFRDVVGLAGRCDRSRKLRQHRVIEQIGCRNMDSGEAGPRNGLDAQNRIAAYLKEVVIPSNWRHTEYGRPDISKSLFDRAAWIELIELIIGSGGRRNRALCWARDGGQCVAVYSSIRETGKF